MELTEQQLKAIDLTAEAYDIEYICKELDITHNVYKSWYKDYDFRQKVIDRSKELILDVLPSLYKLIKTKALSNEFKYVKLLLEHIETINQLDNRHNQTTIVFNWDNGNNNTIPSSDTPDSLS